MDDRKLRDLADRAQHLTALKNNQSYPVLKAIVEERIRLETKKFVSTVNVESQALDYGRGYMAGMDYVLRIIEGGEKELQRAYERARKLEEIEQATKE